MPALVRLRSACSAAKEEINFWWARTPVALSNLTWPLSGHAGGMLAACLGAMVRQSICLLTCGQLVLMRTTAMQLPSRMKTPRCHQSQTAAYWMRERQQANQSIDNAESSRMMHATIDRGTAMATSGVLLSIARLAAQECQSISRHTSLQPLPTPAAGKWWCQWFHPTLRFLTLHWPCSLHSQPRRLPRTVSTTFKRVTSFNQLIVSREK